MSFSSNEDLPESSGVGIRPSISLDGNTEDIENAPRIFMEPNVLVQHEVSSIELMARCLNQQALILRFWLRALGVRFREAFATFCNNSLRMCGTYLRRMILKYSDMEAITFEGDAAMIFNEVPLQMDRKPPKYTINNLEVVLTTDDVEQGILHRIPLLFPKWSELPSRVKTESIIRDDISEFQLFNKPLSVAMTMDDEDDLLSIGSTRTGAGVAETLQSMEAQVAMLTKQLQYFMSLRNNEKDGSPDQAPSLSDDEGKGTSVCSPSSAGKVLSVVNVNVDPKPSIPRVCTPSMPPPPPPPPNLLKSSNFTKPLKPLPEPVFSRDENRTPDNFSDGGGDREPIVRPSVSDLRTVRLKKTNADRSPGGTPLPRGRRSSIAPELDQGAFLHAALRAKFRTMQENSSFSEQEDDTSSVWEDS